MKNFTKTITNKTLFKPTRWLIMALMLLVGTSSAWGWNQSNVELFFDNSTSKWTNCYVYIGKDDYTSCYALTRVSGTQYLWKLDKGFNSGKSWDGATGWVVSKEKWWDGNGENVYKFVYHGNNNVTNIRTSEWVNTTIYKADGTTNVNHYSTNCTVYNFSTSTKSDYTVTINSPTGGTLTVKDYDNNTVSNGASKIGLTVLKFSAAASTGYTFKEVQINNGSSTTTISAANIDQTYTVTSNVTITPVWTANQYTISYKDKGNVTFSGTHANGYPTKHTYGTATTLKTATKADYTFKGWFTKSDCSGTPVASLGATAYTANITLYALWELACVTVEEPDITYNSSVCLGSALTLTLNERQEGVTYKIDNQEIFTGNNKTYSFTPQASGSLTVVASHLNACNGATNKKDISYTVNTLPNAPILTTDATNVCPGTVTLSNFKAMSEPNTVVWYSDKDCTQEVTKPTVENGNTYTFYAKSKNASGCFSDSYSTLEVNVYDNPADFTLTAIPTEICSGEDVVISISNKQNGVTYKLGDTSINESITVNPTETSTYIVTASLNACPALTNSISTEITVHPIPSFKVEPSNLSICIGATNVTDLTELSHVAVENGKPVWYDAETAGNVVTDADLVNGGTYWVAAEDNETGCVNTERKSFTLTINDLPKYPDITKPSAAVCQANATVSLNELAEISDVIWYQGNDEVQNPDAVSIANEGTFTYTAKAVNANGCQSATGVDFTLTVNPLPTITIAGNPSAVFYEDVTLTATATAGATIKWYEGGVEKATGTTYVVTSATEASKTVTAKAFLGGCESTVASHTVAFSEEDCADVTTTVEETVGKIKLLLSKPSWIGSGEKFYCYAWENNTTSTLLGGWPGTELTQKEGSYYVIIVDSNNKNIKIILNDGTEQTVDSDVLNANKIYQISATSSKNSDNKYTFNSKTDKGTYKESVTTTVPAPITAPAVKTVSFETTPGDGNINFSGQIVKTGCDNSLTYGYEYKKVGAANWTQVVLGRDLDKDAGFTFSDNTIKDLDGEYVVRAFITNDNSTQYGAEITNYLSTTQEPVRTATIQLTESDGTPVANDKKYCVGETAYIMVESDVKYTEVSWKSQQGVDIVQTRLMNMYQFVVKGNDNIVVLLSNKYNVTPAESNTIEVYTYDDPVLPTVSLNKVSICSNDAVGATVKLTNVVKGQTYQLYQQIDNGDDTFTENAIGSAKTQTEEVTDKTELVLHTLTNTAETGKYFVKTYTEQCTKNMAATQPFTFTVVDASDVFIGFEPTSATTTPWMPAKFTVSASDAYTLNVTKGNPAEAATEAEVSQNGNNVSVKIPLPEGATGGEGQYENVVFPGGATTQYTITATLSATGGDDNPCATPANATITLVPYVEECTIGH